LWYVVPNTLLIGDLLLLLQYQITDQQHIGYNIPQAVLQSKAPEDGQNCCLKHVKLNWIYQ